VQENVSATKTITCPKSRPIGLALGPIAWVCFVASCFVHSNNILQLTAVGLEFLSFDSKVEQDLFVKLAAKQSGMFNPGYGFVGAIKSVQGNASSYIWVTTNQALRYNLSWSSTNPDNWGGNEHCLNVQAWTPEFVFNDITCDSDYLPFICQKTKPRTG